MEEHAPYTPTPTLAGRHTTLVEAMAYQRKKGVRCRHAPSKTHVVLWCATNPAQPASEYVPKCRATVHVRYVESTSPDDIPFWQSMQGDTHGDACCYYNWESKVPSFGSWFGDGVREFILDACFKTNLRARQIVEQLHGNGSNLTRVRLHNILSSFPRESSDEDTLILLGHTYHTPKKKCMVFNTLQWLRNARLQAIEAKRCGQCHKTVYLWCMHCEGCGFCLHTLECPVHGRAHPNTDKWLLQKWCKEVDIEEVLTTTLPNEPLCGDEELDVFSSFGLSPK